MAYHIRPRTDQSRHLPLLPGSAFLYGLLVSAVTVSTANATEHLLTHHPATLSLTLAAGTLVSAGLIWWADREVRCEAQQSQRGLFIDLLRQLPPDWRVLCADVQRDRGDRPVAALYVVTPQQHTFLLLHPLTASPLRADPSYQLVTAARELPRQKPGFSLNAHEDAATFPRPLRGTRAVLLDLHSHGSAQPLGTWTLSPGPPDVQAARLTAWAHVTQHETGTTPGWPLRREAFLQGAQAQLSEVMVPGALDLPLRPGFTLDLLTRGDEQRDACLVHLIDDECTLTSGEEPWELDTLLALKHSRPIREQQRYAQALGALLVLWQPWLQSDPGMSVTRHGDLRLVTRSAELLAHYIQVGDALFSVMDPYRPSIHPSLIP